MTTRKPPPKGPAPDTLPPYDHFDPIPQPEVSERNTDTMWQTWHELREQEDARYAETEPITRAGQLPANSRRDSQPPGAPLRPAPASRASGLDQLVEESRRNNRVCPMPGKWKELDALLRSAAPAGAAESLPPPLPLREWQTTTSLAKRLMFRSVIDWAGRNGLVEPALQFVRALPDEHWHHMGD
jgi:hypothetical protein